MTARVRSITIAAAAAGLLVTFVVVTVPFIRFAYRSPSAHAAIETAAALTALLVAYLVFWRFRRSGSRSDLLLAIALTSLASTSMLFSAVPAMIGAHGPFATWTAALTRLFSAGLLVVAAFARPSQVRRPRHAALLAAAYVLASIAAIAALVALVGHPLPSAVDPALSPKGARVAWITGPPSVVLLHVLHTLLYVAAAIGFVRRSERDGDELMSWLAIAAVVGGLSRLNYMLFPSLYSQWVYTGDFFRLAFFLILLLGAAREIQAYHRLEVERAALEERGRIARDLHDGLAQELSFIATETRSLVAYPDDLERVPQLAAAAERALDEARDAISALTRPVDEPLDVLLQRAANKVAARVGATVVVEAEPGWEAPPEEREGLVRIVREAVANATRHGGARSVRVHLLAGEDRRLVVIDDGCGFDPSVGRSNGGFGLTSMSERARRIGGRFDIRSSPGAGTTVEVSIP